MIETSKEDEGHQGVDDILPNLVASVSTVSTTSSWLLLLSDIWSVICTVWWQIPSSPTMEFWRKASSKSWWDKKSHLMNLKKKILWLIKNARYVSQILNRRTYVSCFQNANIAFMINALKGGWEISRLAHIAEAICTWTFYEWFYLKFSF